MNRLMHWGSNLFFALAFVLALVGAVILFAVNITLMFPLARFCGKKKIKLIIDWE